jgi:hypothetical protein
MENVEFVNTQQAKQVYHLNNYFIQLCAPDDGAIRDKILQELVFYNIIVILTKLCAFFSLNCNN